MADLEARLALHAYLLEAATALDEAERRLVSALGYATSLGGESTELAERLTEETQRVRAAAKMINGWLDGAA